MNRKVSISVAVVVFMVLVCLAATVPFVSFQSTQFSTNNNTVSILPGTLLTNPAVSGSLTVGNLVVTNGMSASTATIGTGIITTVQANSATFQAPTTNRPAVWINHTLSNAPAATDGQFYVADAATAGGIKATNLNGSFPLITNGFSLVQAYEQPLLIRACGPAINAVYTLDIAHPNEAMLLEYSFDEGKTWLSLFPDGGFQFTNAPGMHDMGFHIGSDGTNYVPYTLQSTDGTSLATNIGLVSSTDFINWSNVGVGAIPMNTNTSTGVTWAPDWITVNGVEMIYGTATTHGPTTFDGKIVAIVASDSTFTSWTSPSSMTVIATNEGSVTGPYGAWNGLNDSYAFLITNTLIVSNNAGATVTLTNGTFALIAYSGSVQYDLYTNTQASMPSLCHLALTNVTSFPRGSEGGCLYLKTNGVYRFFGSVGVAGSNDKGRFFYSDSSAPGVLNFTTANYCQEYPRMTFGQSTVTALTGTNKLKFLEAISRSATVQAKNSQLYGSVMALATMKLPGYFGPAMDVRRSVDNKILTIPFAQSGGIDTNILLTFCSTGNGFVTTWYDQSGYQNNATNSTNANQPQIVSNGVLLVDGSGNATVKWGSPFSLQTRPLSVVGGFSTIGWHGRNWNTAAYAAVVESADYGASGGAGGFGFTSSAGSTALDWTTKSMLVGSSGFANTGFSKTYALPNSGFLNSTNNGVFYEIETVTGATNQGIWINGAYSSTLVAQGPSLATVTNVYVGGGPSTDFNDGYISCIILYPVAILPQAQVAMRKVVTDFYTSPHSSPGTATSKDFGWRAGTIAFGNLSTSQAVTFSYPMPPAVGTNYSVTTTMAGGGNLADTVSAGTLTTNGFTASLLTGISGGTNAYYIVLPNN
jgi:hypothetical protein